MANNFPTTKEVFSLLIRLPCAPIDPRVEAAIDQSRLDVTMRAWPALPASQPAFVSGEGGGRWSENPSHCSPLAVEIMSWQQSLVESLRVVLYLLPMLTNINLYNAK